jgi:negative regulator of flagellin synthesis FlgM
MSNNIESTRSNFFPNSKSAAAASRMNQAAAMKRNSPARQSELDSMAKADSKVDISSSIKEFARIKSAVDTAPEIDNSEKIARLKSQIKGGTYKVDYEGLADKILASEF